MTSESTELLLLSINDLNRIQAEFLEAYNTLMDVACQRLEYALVIKLDCITRCERDQGKKSNDSNQKSIKDRLKAGLTLRVKKF
mmetsp:Transcript_28161/g.42633  ORF Transcript_28161/g.42633 Transcript_28161/m.42633 type:complete len:84 (+) Transcript_28161:1887-2138(+)